MLLDKLILNWSWRRSLVFCGACLLSSASSLHAQSAESDATEEGTDEVVDAEAPAAAQAAPPRLKSFRAAVQAGVGVTERLIELSHSHGRLRLDSGLSAALDIRVSGGVTDRRHFLGASAAYQTSLGLAGGDRVRLSSAGPMTTPMRSHRFEVGIAPGFWLGDGPASTGLGLFIGYAGRAFGSVTELLIPRYTLHGPVLRLELEIPISRQLSLRIAPEANLIVSITEELRDVGALVRWGLAYGGQLSLQAKFSSKVSMRLWFREAHAYAGAFAAMNARLVDIERYLLLDAVVRY